MEIPLPPTFLEEDISDEIAVLITPLTLPPSADNRPSRRVHVATFRIPDYLGCLLRKWI
jgi:hypothetical protein